MFWLNASHSSFLWSTPPHLLEFSSTSFISFTSIVLNFFRVSFVCSFRLISAHNVDLLICLGLNLFHGIELFGCNCRLIAASCDLQILSVLSRFNFSFLSSLSIGAFSRIPVPCTIPYLIISVIFTICHRTTAQPYHVFPLLCKKLPVLTGDTVEILKKNVA